MPGDAIAEHYGSDDLVQRLRGALRASGKDLSTLTPADLAPLDQFHTGGINSTRGLATFAGLTPGERVIDLGCGLGGPARILAAEFGCEVVGIDLTASFIAAARDLTASLPAPPRVRFEVADALDLPFADGSFDVAWTQHVTMNIAEKGRFYREAYRVLRPGGRFAFLDVLAGNGEPLTFPVPWAATPEISFLAAPGEVRATIGEAGFVEERWEDLSVEFAGLRMSRQLAASGALLGLHVVLGPEIGDRLGNLSVNAEAGRVVLVRALYRKPA